MTHWFESSLVTQWLMLLGLLVFLGLGGLLAVRLWREEPCRMQILAIIVVAGLLRFAWAYVFQPEQVSDFMIYWQYAQQFYQGDPTYIELIRHPGIPIIYAWLIRAFGDNLFGNGLWVVWLSNLVFSTVAMLAMYRMTSWLAGYRAALFGILAYALFPQAIAYNAMAGSEVMGIAFSLLFLWAVLEGYEREQKILYWALLGVLLYTTVLIRSSNLLYAGLIPFIFLLTRRDMWRHWVKRLAVFMVTLGLFLSTWLYHQYLLAGEAKLFWGVEVWLACAIQYQNNGRYTYFRDMAMYPKIKPYLDYSNPPKLIQGYKVMMAEDLAVIKADPVKFLKFGFVRMDEILRTSQSGIRFTEQGSPSMRTLPQRWIKKTASVSNIYWQIMMALSVAGSVIACLKLWRKPGRQYQEPARQYQEVVAFLGFYTVLWLLFHYLLAVAGERYAFQIIPFVIMLAAVSVGWVLDVILQRSRSLSLSY